MLLVTLSTCGSPDSIIEMQNPTTADFGSEVQGGNTKVPLAPWPFASWCPDGNVCSHHHSALQAKGENSGDQKEPSLAKSALWRVFLEAGGHTPRAARSERAP